MIAVTHRLMGDVNAVAWLRPAPAWEMTHGPLSRRVPAHQLLLLLLVVGEKGNRVCELCKF